MEWACTFIPLLFFFHFLQNIYLYVERSYIPLFILPWVFDCVTLFLLLSGSFHPTFVAYVWAYMAILTKEAKFFIISECLMNLKILMDLVESDYTSVSC